MHVVVFVGLILLICFAAIELGLVASPFSRVKIVVSSGRVELAKGSIGPRARELATDIVRSSRVGSGFITVSSRGKVRFSRNIPHDIRQQLRNVLLL